MTKSKPIYHARNVNRLQGSVKSRSERKPITGLGETRPFIGLLILDMIHRFIFGHVVVIHYTRLDFIVSVHEQ